MPKTVRSKASPETSPQEAQPDIERGTAPTREEVELRAYYIYLERAEGQGGALDDWLQAEQELTATR